MKTRVAGVRFRGGLRFGLRPGARTIRAARSACSCRTRPGSSIDTMSRIVAAKLGRRARQIGVRREPRRRRRPDRGGSRKEREADGYTLICASKRLDDHRAAFSRNRFPTTRSPISPRSGASP